MELEETINNLYEIVNLCKEEISNSDNNTTATLDIKDLKSLQLVLQALEDYKKNLYRVNDENVKLKVLIHDLQQQLENSIPKETIRNFIENNAYVATYDFRTIEVNELEKLLKE